MRNYIFISVTAFERTNFEVYLRLNSTMKFLNNLKESSPTQALSRPVLWFQFDVGGGRI